MTHTDAVAYGVDGIRVNSVLPGFTKTPSAATPRFTRRNPKLDVG